VEIYAAYNEDGKAYDFYDSYEAMHNALVDDSAFKSYKVITVDESEIETLNKFILAKHRLQYLAGKKAS